MGETTSSAWIGACRDAVMGSGVACRDAVWDSRGACRDTVVVDNVDVTTGLCCREAFCNAGLGDIVDVTTDPIRGGACRDAVMVCGVACLDANLGGTADVTTGP